MSDFSAGLGQCDAYFTNPFVRDIFLIINDFRLFER